MKDFDCKIPVEYKGVRYPSLTAAGRKFGLAATVVKSRLAKGQPLEVRFIGKGKMLKPPLPPSPFIVKHAGLQVSAQTYDEIARLLRKRGYHHIFDVENGAIYMDHIALTRAPDRRAPAA